MLLSHDLAMVRALADRVAVMHEGRVVESGPAAVVLDAPRHDYTRRLLATRLLRAPAPRQAPHHRSSTCGTWWPGTAVPPCSTA
ncbi:hypothetical protein ACFQ0B_13875 [Nonomuraea thailandensis]